MKHIALHVSDALDTLISVQALKCSVGYIQYDLSGFNTAV